MKENIENFLFDKLWESVKDIVPEEVYVPTHFYRTEIATKKFEELFPSVSLSTVAFVSNKLAESGIIISLATFCDFAIRDAFQRSLMLFTYDLNTIPADYVSSHIVQQEGEIPHTVTSKVEDESPNIELKPIKWKDHLNTSSSHTFKNLDERIEEIQGNYPDALVMHISQPWLKIVKQLDEVGIDVPDHDFVKQLFIKFLKDNQGSFRDTFDEVVSEMLFEFKAFVINKVLEKNPNHLKVGINKNISIYIDLPPLKLDQDYSEDEVRDMLNIDGDHWTLESNNAVFFATADALASEYNLTVKITGNYFIFPNNSENISTLNMNEPFYVVPEHKLDPSDIETLLNNFGYNRE